MIFYQEWCVALLQTGRLGRGDTSVSEFYWIVILTTVIMMPIGNERKSLV